MPLPSLSLTYDSASWATRRLHPNGIFTGPVLSLFAAGLSLNIESALMSAKETHLPAGSFYPIISGIVRFSIKNQPSSEVASQIFLRNFNRQLMAHLNRLTASVGHLGPWVFPK